MTTLGVDSRGVGDAAGQVRAKVDMASPVLFVRPVPGAVPQDRLELIVIMPGHIDLAIDHDARDALPDPLAHDPCFRVLDGEPFLERDRGDLDREAGDRLRKDAPPEKTRSSA